MMRLLNRKFLNLSKDKYLDNFFEEQGDLYFEVRNEDDLAYLKKMIRYTNAMKSQTCLHIQFWYNFQPKDDQSEEAEARELVDVLFSARGYGKLTIGPDGTRSRYLPKVFLNCFVEELGRRQTVINELVFDLQHYGRVWSPPVQRVNNNVVDYPNQTEFVDKLAEVLVDNLHVKNLALLHGNWSTLRGLFNGLRTQQANIAELPQSNLDLENRNLGLKELILQDSHLQDNSLSEELTQKDQSLLKQLTSLKVYQCRFEHVSWRKLVRNNNTLTNLIVENTEGCDDTDGVNVANFAGDLKENIASSRLEKFDFAISIQQYRSQPGVPMDLWGDLQDLRQQGTLKQFHLHCFDNNSARNLAGSGEKKLQDLKPYLHIRRMSSFKWPPVVSQWA